MNMLEDLSKEQLLEIFELLGKKGIKEFILLFGNDIDSIAKLVSIRPLAYNSLNIELKKNKQIIENTYKSFIKYKETGIDFYETIENSNDKVKSYCQIFGGLSCREDILKMLIIDEFCSDRTTQLLDEYNELVLNDDKLLNDVLTICGFVGKLSELTNNKRFISKVVKINGDLLLLASEELKKDRSLISEAIISNPIVAFELDLSDEDSLIKTAVEMIKKKADKYIELPCQYND